MSSTRPAGPVALLAVAAAVAAATGAALPAGAATTATTTTTTSGKPTPNALLAASLAAAKSQPSVHFVAVSTIGKRSISITADVAKTKGKEAIVVTSGQSTGHVAVRLVNRAVYFQGDATGLAGYLGMSSTLASKYAGTWIRFGHSDPTYKSISQAITLGSAVGQISVKAPLANGAATTVNGVPAVSVTGSTTELGGTGPAALYLPAQGSVLPLRYTGQGTQKKEKATGQVDFSHWGETVAVAVPAKSVEASSI